MCRQAVPFVACRVSGMCSNIFKFHAVKKTENRTSSRAAGAGGSRQGRRGELQDKVKSICRASFLLSLFHVDHDVLTLSPLANRDVSCFFLYYSSKYFTGQA